MIGRWSMVLVGLLAATGVQAQTPQSAVRVDRQTDVMFVRGPGQDGAPLPFGPAEFDFVAVPFGVGGDTVAGAPYSAEAVTEVLQTLADGNRIVRQSSAAVHRDAAGRTRREQGLAVLGNAVGDRRKQVHITDPVSGEAYLLNVERQEAHRLPAPRIRALRDGKIDRDGLGTFNLPVPPPPGGGQGAVFISRQEVASNNQARAEQLGKTMIEGVEAEGTRSTVTIPAGQIGNEQPIAIVSERWFSPDLKVLVMSRQSDPRFGETTYRLTNIVRGEPSPDLFQVPPDFKIVETPPGPGAMFHLEKK